MKLTKAISKRVINLLTERNMTQYELCKHGGVPSSILNDVVNTNKKTH